MKTTHTQTRQVIRIIMIGTMVTLLMAWNINCFGQDTIVQWKGDSILSNVKEVTETTIKYNRFDNPEGPLYVLKRDLISFIKYKNGSVDSFPEIKPWFRPVSEEPIQKAESMLNVTPTFKKKRYEIDDLGGRFTINTKPSNRNEVLDILKRENDPEMNKYIRKSKAAGAFRPVMFVGIPLALTGLVIAAEGGSGTGLGGPDNEVIGVTMMLAGGGCIGGAFALKNIQKKSTAKAVKIYNAKY